MSYDVMMLKFKGARPESAEEIEPEGLAPLGAAADVRRQISNVLDGTDWSDPTWGRFEGDGFSVEFNVGADDPIDSMMLHLRGGGDAIANRGQTRGADWVGRDRLPDRRVHRS